MAVTKYGYTKSTNLGRIKQEIIASSIITALDHITLNDTALDIYFKAALSTADITTLDALVVAHVNTPLAELAEQRDSEGALIIRPKAAKLGRTYQLHYLHFVTSQENSLIEKDYLGNDIGHSALTFWKPDGSGGIVSCLDVDAEITRIDYAPPYDYEIVGGEIRSSERPIQDTYLYVIGVPDVAAPNGSKVMVQGANMRFFGRESSVKADGKVTKSMKFTTAGIPDGWGNKIRFYIRHHKGTLLDIQVGLEIFKA